MKQKIKDFLFKKRIKILKNKKGFSLLEVLVAVAIIGIISAIAVPRFQDYREQAGLVAGDTSIGNMAKAFHNCATLNAFTSCDTLSEIKITCPDCDTENNSNDYPICFSYEKKAGGKNFRMCVGIDSSGVETRKIGGDFKVCHKECSACTPAVPKAVVTAIKRCENANNNFCGTNGTPTNWTYTCEKQAAATAGKCSTAGVCQS